MNLETLGLLAVLAIFGLAGLWCVLWVVKRWEGVSRDG